MTGDPRPWPPSDINGRTLRAVAVPAGTTLFRYFRKIHEPIYFDPSASGRLNAPDGSYGVLYAAERDVGAFAETFLRKPGRTLLSTSLIAERARVRLRTTRTINFAQMHGPALSIMGATAEVTAGGEPYALAQAWSKALHGHPMSFDGVAYRARHDNDEICYALFERAISAIEEAGRDTDLDGDWFYDLMDHYNVGLTP